MSAAECWNLEPSTVLGLAKRDERRGGLIAVRKTQFYLRKCAPEDCLAIIQMSQEEILALRTSPAARQSEQLKRAFSFVEEAFGRGAAIPESFPTDELARALDLIRDGIERDSAPLQTPSEISGETILALPEPSSHSSTALNASAAHTGAAEFDSPAPPRLAIEEEMDIESPRFRPAALQDFEARKFVRHNRWEK